MRNKPSVSPSPTIALKQRQSGVSRPAARSKVPKQRARSRSLWSPRRSVLLFLLLLVLAGTSIYIYVYHWYAQPRPPAPQTVSNSVLPDADQYADWATCTDKRAGISFRYPATWTLVTPDNPCSTSQLDRNSYGELVLESLPQSGSPYIFQLMYSDVLVSLGEPIQSFYDPSQWETIESVIPLAVPGNNVPLSIAANTGDQFNPSGIMGMNLTAQTYREGQVVHQVSNEIYVHEGSNRTAAVSMLVLLLKTTEVNDNNPPTYPLTTWQAQLDYQTILKVFESLSFQ